MNTFRFSMQTILELRERVEERERAHFELLERSEAAARDELSSLRQTRQRGRRSGWEHDLGALRWDSYFRESYDDRIRQADSRWKNARVNLERQRVKLRDATVARKKIEKIRDKRLKRFKRQEALREERQAEEAYRFMRRRWA